MGCDIHWHAEVKVNGRWEHYKEGRFDRDYNLFARMADVRNGRGIEPIALPRGLPKDITYLTNFDRENWGCDGHSDSWLSAEEIAALGEWYEEQQKRYGEKWWRFEHHTALGYLFGNGWNLKKYPDDYPKGVEDARLIFWFDN